MQKTSPYHHAFNLRKRTDFCHMFGLTLRVLNHQCFRQVFLLKQFLFYRYLLVPSGVNPSRVAKSRETGTWRSF